MRQFPKTSTIFVFKIQELQGTPETTSPCQTTATTKKRGRPPKTLHLPGQMKIQSFLVQKQPATSTSRIEREPSRIINEKNSTTDAAKCQTLVGKKTIEVGKEMGKSTAQPKKID